MLDKHYFARTCIGFSERMNFGWYRSLRYIKDMMPHLALQSKYPSSYNSYGSYARGTYVSVDFSAGAQPYFELVYNVIRADLSYYKYTFVNCIFGPCILIKTQIRFRNCMFYNCKFNPGVYSIEDSTLLDCDTTQASFLDTCYGLTIENCSGHANRINGCPPGEYIAYKACLLSTRSALLNLSSPRYCLVKLRIPEDAKRVGALSGKCRASKAEVIEFQWENSRLWFQKWLVGQSWRIHTFTYRVGQTVEPWLPFSNTLGDVCASGIHHYIDRRQAIDQVIEFNNHD